MTLNLDILKKDEKNLVFIIEGISIEMANAIRRIMLTEIPVMAIDEVIILKNDSPLYDEIISHRLGLIPLTTDLETYKLPQDCECSGFGCPLCQVSLTCEITNTTSNFLEIYSGDLKSNDPLIVPVSPHIPLVKIDKDDKVIIEAYAMLGIEKDHTKWKAVTNVYYRFYPKVDFDESKCTNCPDKCIVSRMCPKDLFDFSSNKAPKLLKDYQEICDLCNACKLNCPENAIKTDHEKNKYIFSIENDGSLTFDTIIKKTFEIFNEKIEELRSSLEELDMDLNV